MKELGPSSKSQTVAKDRVIQVMSGAVGDQRGLKRRLRYTALQGAERGEARLEGLVGCGEEDDALWG